MKDLDPKYSVKLVEEMRFIHDDNEMEDALIIMDKVCG